MSPLARLSIRKQEDKTQQGALVLLICIVLVHHIKKVAGKW